MIAEFAMELCVAHTYCAEYFRLMQSLNALMLFKFFPSDPDGQRFTAMAVLYIRASEGHIVADAVSFGMRLLPSSAAVPPIAKPCRTPSPTTGSRGLPVARRAAADAVGAAGDRTGTQLRGGAAAGEAPSPAAGPGPGGEAVGHVSRRGVCVPQRGVARSARARSRRRAVWEICRRCSAQAGGGSIRDGAAAAAQATRARRQRRAARRSERAERSLPVRCAGRGKPGGRGRQGRDAGAQ